MSDNSSASPDPATSDESDCTGGLTVVLDTDAGASPPDSPWIERMLGRVVGMLELSLAELTVVIVDDHRMIELARGFAHEPQTTDVLSFDLRDDPSASAPTAGEIYVCLDEARRRAEELGHDANHELLLYAVHGLLHLMGHDDHDPDQRRAMHRREDELLEAIGVGAVYAAQDRCARGGEERT